MGQAQPGDQITDREPALVVTLQAVNLAKVPIIDSGGHPSVIACLRIENSISLPIVTRKAEDEAFLWPSIY